MGERKFWRSLQKKVLKLYAGKIALAEHLYLLTEKILEDWGFNDIFLIKVILSNINTLRENERKEADEAKRVRENLLREVVAKEKEPENAFSVLSHFSKIKMVEENERKKKQAENRSNNNNNKKNANSNNNKVDNDDNDDDDLVVVESNNNSNNINKNNSNNNKNNNNNSSDNNNNNNNKNNNNNRSDKSNNNNERFYL